MKIPINLHLSIFCFSVIGMFGNPILAEDSLIFPVIPSSNGDVILLNGEKTLLKLTFEKRNDLWAYEALDYRIRGAGMNLSKRIGPQIYFLGSYNKKSATLTIERWFLFAPFLSLQSLSDSEQNTTFWKKKLSKRDFSANQTIYWEGKALNLSYPDSLELERYIVATEDIFDLNKGNSGNQ